MRGIVKVAVASALIISCLETAPSAVAVPACTTSQSNYVLSSTTYTAITISQSGSCIWTVSAGVTQADVLIVGGGGGGAGGNSGSTGSAGGGGGGGAMVATSYPLTPAASLSITVGAGGAGGPSTSGGDSTLGSQGGTTTFDQITAGGGGGGGYSSVNGFLTQAGLPGTAGGGGGGASNHWYAYNDGSSTVASGGTGTTKIVGARTYTGINGGNGGVYVAGVSPSNTSAVGGGAAGSATSANPPVPGAAFSTNISGTTTNYGGGGLADGATSWVNGTRPTGVGFGGWGGLGSVAGTSGNSGIVIIRYLYVPITVNSFNLSGSASTATYRAATTIQVNVSSTAVVTFYAANKKIPGCTKITATGTSPNIIAQCTWKPATHGGLTLTAQISPPGGGITTSTGQLRIGVLSRTGNR